MIEIMERQLLSDCVQESFSKRKENIIMIRTNVVKLTTIPAVAYRHKMTDGGSGITILRYDSEQPGIASISNSTGKPIPAKNTSLDRYPAEAFEEAMKLTYGMPYKNQKKVILKEEKVEEAAEEPEPQISMADRPEYIAVVTKYLDKNGTISYSLLNKDLIQFAHRSSIAKKMISENKPLKEIRNYIVGSKFRTISENPDLTDQEVEGISQLLDEVSPKGVYKELNDELKKLLKAAKH